jgi:hypothetical protein
LRTGESNQPEERSQSRKGWPLRKVRSIHNHASILLWEESFRLQGATGLPKKVPKIQSSEASVSCGGGEKMCRRPAGGISTSLEKIAIRETLYNIRTSSII